MDKIFIQMVAYRDPELLPTIRNCLATAKYPENLVFSICWQHSVDDEWDNLDEFIKDSRFKILDIPFTESEGVCWARNLVQQQYNDESYTLQLDSHHRFEENWDVELISMLKGLQSTGHAKPLITTYAPSYHGETEVRWDNAPVIIMRFDRFTDEGIVLFSSFRIKSSVRVDNPIPAKFYSAHYCFTLGLFSIEVRHDPNLYFFGEEISIAVRAYTHGYDLFHPNKCLVYHEYLNPRRKRHWEDHPNWWKRDLESLRKCRILLGMEPGEIDLDVYGFGNVRSLSDYECFSGIDFKQRTHNEKNALHSYRKK